MSVHTVDPGAQARAAGPGVAFDPLDPGFIADPYPTYAVLRRAAPILRQAPDGPWFLSRHADIAAALRDRRFVRRPPTPREPGHLPAFHALQTGKLIDAEPPDHTRLKAMVNRAFTPARVEALRPRVGELADELLDVGVSDLIEDYAAIIPVAVIGELLGVPRAEQHRLRPWSNAIVAMWELARDAETEQRAEAASAEFTTYLSELVAFRRAHHGEDLLSALIAHGMSDHEVVVMGAHLLNAGHEATVNGLGNSVFALLSQRREWDRLAAEPALVAGAVEELLRFDTPLQQFARTASEAVEYGGVRFRTGDQVVLFYGSANRDPEVFAEPDRLDVTRSPNPHLVFGLGIHFCLGAPLARLELAESLGALVRRRPELDLNGPPVRRPGLTIRAFAALPVTRY